jgi:hypothetical protein
MYLPKKRQIQYRTFCNVRYGKDRREAYRQLSSQVSTTGRQPFGYTVPTFSTCIDSITQITQYTVQYMYRKGEKMSVLRTVKGTMLYGTHSISKVPKHKVPVVRKVRYFRALRQTSTWSLGSKKVR